jgi:hypothetical protein
VRVLSSFLFQCTGVRERVEAVARIVFASVRRKAIGFRMSKVSVDEILKSINHSSYSSMALGGFFTTPSGIHCSP